MARSTFHVVMYPWFAIGHITPFLHLANKLAKRGNKVSFFCPTRAESKLKHLNCHPTLISFVPVVVPHVEGLPHGAETTGDISVALGSLLMNAMDLTQTHIELALRHLKPDIVFFDIIHWMPALASRLGIKSIHYSVVNSAYFGYVFAPARKYSTDLLQPPPGFPPSTIKIYAHELQDFTVFTAKKKGERVSLQDRILIGMSGCDAITFRTCRELEGLYCDYIGNQFRKPVLLLGPAVPVPPTTVLEDRWAKWLSGFKAGSVVYCAFGSECTLKKEQFQQVILGLELTGLPFFAALKPPFGTETVEEALPEGFEERVEGRGVVHGGWVQQQLILGHSSVGCFVTHCGYGSLSEALVNECQLVLLPHGGDQILNARMMSGDLKVGVEVEKGEEGLFTKESVCKAVKSVMDQDSEIGTELRGNHANWRDFLLSKGFEASYFDGFIHKLEDMLGTDQREQ
ncbi:hypothetical protein HHK36_003657 [Tetracentron sinense]|uniref:Glycosyltransferase n=1 Tax=Tetracentron sinense TaxID=13715 RepID=A0A835DNT5_TETSI|nr:hypothetical protein HHK36_003657 [Tetracentron sinense]